MRRSRLTLSTSLAAIGLSATIALAQQTSQGPAPSGPAQATDDSGDPLMASRPTRYLLRNGLDYLAYREYARALNFFRAVEARQADLNDAELKQLKNGIARAQQGLREAVNNAKVATASSKGRAVVQPGAFALAKPGQGQASAPIDPLQLASAELPAPPPISASDLPALPPPMAAPAEPTQDPAPARSTSRSAFGGLAQTRVKSPFADPPAAPAEPTASDPATRPAKAAASSTEPAELPPNLPAPAIGSPELPPPLVLEVTSPTPSPMPSETPMPASVGAELPPLIPPGAEPLPMPSSSLAPMAADAPAPVEPNVPMVAQRGEPSHAERPASRPSTAPEPPPAPEVPSGPEVGSAPSMSSAALEKVAEGILSPRLAREVIELAQRPPADERPQGNPIDPMEPPAPSQGSPRLELPRAPSPTEARPLRRIPVPEEFVTLGKREWDPNRKYWAAAGTCHMILYFQDPVLERYGQGVEQSLGPIGRYFSYPLDDPKQSNQRNQILQPFYSIGKLCFQVGTLPYKLVVDPPWEAEYDLGYYRPGDRIPPDTIMITPYGVGPPLKGRQY